MSTKLLCELDILLATIWQDHEGATRANLEALASLLATDARDWNSQRLQHLLREAVGGNCLGTDEWRAVEAYAYALSENRDWRGGGHSAALLRAAYQQMRGPNGLSPGEPY